jgi:hypothetical protein
MVGVAVRSLIREREEKNVASANILIGRMLGIK